jgi:heme/copper-type cytochrome/quinol oxidase subunit 2
MRIISKENATLWFNRALPVLLFFLVAFIFVLLILKTGYLSETMHLDAPRPWGIYFQDSATPQMEGLVELHDNILFYLVIILFSVGWVLWSIVRSFLNNKSPISYKYVGHGTLIELIW